jgi:RNA polymerase sigma factor (TIGR02999 family)
MDPSIPALIAATERGDVAARDSLFASLYAELRQMARRELGRHGGPATLSATTLLHEAYLGMAAREGPTFPDRARFMGYAARVMRGVIIDHARERQAIKRGGLLEITSLGTEVADHIVDHRELSEMSAALDQLATVDAPLAQIVDLRFFCGFSMAEIAATTGSSERTVHRRWEQARIYLHQYLRSDAADER